MFGACLGYLFFILSFKILHVWLRPGSSRSSQCPSTTYQPASGATACITCGDGYHCPSGSSVRIPASCSEGTYLESDTAYTSQEDCAQCTTSKDTSEPMLSSHARPERGCWKNWRSRQFHLLVVDFVVPVLRVRVAIRQDRSVVQLELHGALEASNMAVFCD